ncbi:hypothetical protein ABK040_005820 [Willaertia magna]
MPKERKKESKAFVNQFGHPHKIFTIGGTKRPSKDNVIKEGTKIDTTSSNSEVLKKTDITSSNCEVIKSAISKATSSNSEVFPKVSNFAEVPLIKVNNDYYISSIDFKYFIYYSKKKDVFNYLSAYFKKEDKYTLSVVEVKKKLLPFIKFCSDTLKWFKFEDYGIEKLRKGLILIKYDAFINLMKKKIQESNSGKGSKLHCHLNTFSYIFNYDLTPNKHYKIFNLDNERIIHRITDIDINDTDIDDIEDNFILNVLKDEMEEKKYLEEDEMEEDDLEEEFNEDDIHLKDDESFEIVDGESLEFSCI